ncbi:MAG: SpoIIE family protein phosphatase [Rhodocyclaceae bacterium]|nr:SpoIIE family protein phosphatase [Rhodocyclaceae bacterium]
MLEHLQRLFTFGAGRPLAMALLAVLIGLNVVSEHDIASADAPGIADTALRVVGSPFRETRQWWFDGYQLISPRQPAHSPVTIVEIDEASLHEIGQWPWPRNRMAKLIDVIGAHTPAAVGLDIYMPEADGTSPGKVADNLPPEQGTLAAQLRRLPSHDEQLAAALRRVPSVLGAAGFDFQSISTSAGMRTRPLVVKGPDPLSVVRRYPWVLASLPELQAAAAGQALLSVDLSENIVRRIPLVVSINDQLTSGLAMEMLRVATNSSAIELLTSPQSIDHVTVADLTVPTQPNGDIWLHFAREQAGVGRTVSAAKVLAGQADPDLLTGKLVLIGLTGYGLADRRVTALRENVPGIEIQAQVIESLFEGRVLTRPWWIKTSEMLALVLFGAFFVYVVPRASAWLMLGFLGVSTGVGHWAFLDHALLVDGAAAVLTLPLVFGSLMVSSTIEVRQRNRTLAAEQQQLKDQALVVAGELSAARRIQLGSLPRPEKVLNGETRFGLAAFMEPARDVGGDLYDFFMIDERRLCFIVGDVSGKGLPASLFMAVTKTLTQTIARHVDAPPGRIAELANEALVAENPENLFVTVVLGILDVNSGALALVNAGHDAPLRRRATGEVDHLESPPDAGGPPLCMMDAFPYGTQYEQLQPGDTLCLITDGVTEAMSPGGAIYGSERMFGVIAQSATPGAQGLIDELRADVAVHVAGAEPSDDMTLLVIQWTPPVS